MTQFNNTKKSKQATPRFLITGLITGLIVFSMFSVILKAGETDIHAVLKQKVQGYFPEAVKIFQHLHMHPELCYKETKTAKYVADYLRKCGLEVQTGIAGTGIKAVLRGTKPTPVVGIRGDMDALPIHEKTGLPYASVNPGVMHACGHDAHTTNVMIAARVLSEMKDKIPGTIVFVFQPCEEGSPDGKSSGASAMVADGLMENPKIEAMFGLHIMPGPTGLVALREGPLMANAAGIRVTIKGKASHGAFPNEGVDAVYAAASAIMQFQAIISRFKNPNHRAVLSIGKINGGVRSNVIADKVEMEGTVRTFSFETQDMIEKKMEGILKGLQVSMGITYDFKFMRHAKYVKNDKNLYQMITPLFRELLGDSMVEITDPISGSEDFSVYSHQIPSLFFFLAVGENTTVHSPTFKVDENSLKYGPLLLSAAAIEYLESRK